VVRGVAVPPGVQESPGTAAPAVRRVCGGFACGTGWSRAGPRGAFGRGSGRRARRIRGSACPGLSGLRHGPRRSPQDQSVGAPGDRA
jgi:hypothetical protein